MAGRLAADLRRRPGLRLQVEHGLDARHARLLPERPGLPPLPPPPADVLARVRLQRELHPAAVARRGRARQGLAAATRCRATAGSSSRTCARCTPTCGRTPARSCCSWAASSPRSRSGSTTQSLDWHLLEDPGHAGVQSLVRDLNRVYRDEPALWELRLRPGGLLLARAQRRRQQRRRLRAAGRATGEDVLVCVMQPRAGAARRATGSACRAPGAGARRSTPTPSATAARASATSAASSAEAVPVAQPAAVGEVDLPPLGVPIWCRSAEVEPEVVDGSRHARLPAAR